MELCPPFDGWHLDLEGVIHTPSGYRCTPEYLESALWLAGMLQLDLAKRPIFADTPQIEPRRLSETRDYDVSRERLQIIAKRGARCPHCDRVPEGSRLPGER